MNPDPIPADQIAPGRRIRLHLAIRLVDGTQVLSTFDEAPLHFTFGDGTLSPALEQGLLGLTVGEDCHLLAQGAELFGAADAANRHWLPRADFPEHLEPKPGQVIAFTGPAGHEVAGRVVELAADRVLLDFNHPLAEQALNIQVRVLTIEVA